MPKSGPIRLNTQPGEVLDRTVSVEFEFDGHEVRGFKGDTVASALSAAGANKFSRSFKYHRPRGLLCCAGNCPNCLMNVDGEPNVRTCTRPVEPGMKVEHQNAWPSLGLDLLSVLDRFHWLMPVGFYYKALHRPKALWLLARNIIRRVGGLGRIDIAAQHEERYRHRNEHVDVAVVGGGPAGIAAALAAANSGVSVALIDDQPELGGHLRFSGQSMDAVPHYVRQKGYELAREMAAAVHGSPGITVMSRATVFGFYQDNLLGILTGYSIVRLRAKKVVLATGAAETPLLFEDNDRPGVMLASAAQRLINLYAIRPGATAVVATENGRGYTAVLDLMDAGVTIAAVIDGGPPNADNEAAQTVLDRGVRVLYGHRVVKALGRGRVKAAVVAPIAGGGKSSSRIRCDLICMSGAMQPSDALLHQAGGSSWFTGDQAQLHALPKNVLVAGHLAGATNVGNAIAQGELAGTTSVSELNGVGASLREAPAAPAAAEETAEAAAPAGAATGSASRSFVCFCEDVTAHDIDRAIDEGFEDIQTLKRYTTVSMGPCQGKMCGKRLTALCAERTGRAPGEIGVTTDRPPLQPVPLAALAGPSHMPVKRTPMDHLHRELGAEMVDSGGWRRPLHYGSPDEECVAVRERVGIIDVSTLGKLDVVGSDAGALLDRLYTHRFSDLPVGRIRYGLMCSDNGTILDDGTVTRTAEDSYFVTTTSGNADVVEEWFNWWQAGSGWCAHVTNMTSGAAAINVAGPRARETLSKITGIDLSPQAFRYMRSFRGEVAGIPCLLLRIGFVGETGWEVHFPSEYGEYVWSALMQAGQEFGIAPFGLEAQRILRLEKGHLIVGQDTDAASNPLETGSEWVVRFDKDDFIGRGGLSVASQRGPTQKLVGFIMEDGVVPRDGVPVVSGGRPVGRVTSARRSPTLGKGFGLAWVPVELARDGARIEVVVDDRPLPAQVTLEPVYDPEGLRLRS